MQFSSLRGAVGRISGQSEPKTLEEEDALHRMLRMRHHGELNDDNGDIAYNLFGIAVNSVANWAHGMTHIASLYWL